MRLFELLNKFEIFELNSILNPELRYEYTQIEKKDKTYIFTAEYDIFTAELILTPFDEEILFTEKALLNDGEVTGWKMYHDGQFSLIN